MVWGSAACEDFASEGTRDRVELTQPGAKGNGEQESLHDALNSPLPLQALGIGRGSCQ
jgi:hypothetical protein